MTVSIKLPNSTNPKDEPVTIVNGLNVFVREVSDLLASDNDILNKERVEVIFVDESLHKELAFSKDLVINGESWYCNDIDGRPNLVSAMTGIQSDFENIRCDYRLVSIEIQKRSPWGDYYITVRHISPQHNFTRGHGLDAPSPQYLKERKDLLNKYSLKNHFADEVLSESVIYAATELTPVAILTNNYAIHEHIRDWAVKQHHTSATPEVKAFLTQIKNTLRAKSHVYAESLLRDLCSKGKVFEDGEVPEFERAGFYSSGSSFVEVIHTFYQNENVDKLVCFDLDPDDYIVGDLAYDVEHFSTPGSILKELDAVEVDSDKEVLLSIRRIKNGDKKTIVLRFGTSAYNQEL